MLLNIEFLHEATTRPKYKNNFDFDDVTLRPSSVTVQVSQVSRAEAPVVADCAESGPEEIRRFFPIRTYAGRLFRRSTLKGPNGPHNVEWLRAKAADRTQEWNRIREFSSSLPVVETGLEFDSNVEVLRSDRDEHAASLHKWAADSLIVGCELYEACAEPIFYFDTSNIIPLKRLNFQFRSGQLVNENVVEFRLDQAEFAKTWLREELGFNVTLSPEITVLIPEALNQPVDETNVVAACKKLDREIKKRWLPTRTRLQEQIHGIAAKSGLDEYLKLERCSNDYFEALKGDGDRLVAPGKAETQAMVEVIEATLTSYGPQLSKTKAELVVRRCDALCRRWRCSART